MKFKVEQSIDINDLFLSHISQYLVNGCSLLDIGTGNGFVLSQILQKIDKQVQLFGVDNSKEMVSLAKRNLGKNAKIVEASIDNLPFSDRNFDVVTAKNVTRIDAMEIFRVLKDDGVFIFREYGYGKGLIEVAELFSGRIIRQLKPESYVKKLYKANFQVVKLNQFEISRRYNSARELVSIIKSFSFIEGFSESDEAVILKKFRENAIITSDPFILVANKLKGDK
ncbi:class I SAM-dependent methyltransferase [Patescibacteria group bacterium]|nr:class I SAM-dependent methyltransferase [Patescibacteria group bacterium]